MKKILSYFIVTSLRTLFSNEIENIILNDFFWDDASQKYFLDWTDVCFSNIYYFPKFHHKIFIIVGKNPEKLT